MLIVLALISFQACGQKKMETNNMENLPKTEAEWKAKLSEEQAKRKQMILELSSFVNETKSWQTRKFVAKR